MSESGVRLSITGVPQPLDSSKVAIMLVIVMLLPIFNPVSADESVGRDDFGVLEASANALIEERDSGEDDIARNSAEGVLSTGGSWQGDWRWRCPSSNGWSDW